MSVAYLGLGGNLGNPVLTLQQAALSLSQVAGVSSIKVSRLYRTKPVGAECDQPDYINAAAAIETTLSPSELLAVCLSIEHDLGRIRTVRWGARTVDLDLLLFDNLLISEPGLVIPHAMLRKRLFAMLPLADLVTASFTLPPDGRQLSSLIAEALIDPAFADQLPITEMGSDD